MKRFRPWIVSALLTGCALAMAWIALKNLTVSTESEWIATPVRAEASPEVSLSHDSEEQQPRVDHEKAIETSDDAGFESDKEDDSESVLEIAWSDILHVDIPAVAVDIDVSGETWPRQTINCRETEECIDPPIPNQAAWYGVVPAIPSTGTVRIFAHNTPHGRVEESFNNLPAMVSGDKIVVTTETGVFTYRAEEPQLVPYAEVPESDLVWGNDPDRLVLVTCNNAETSGTIVEAWLVEATPR